MSKNKNLPAIIVMFALFFMIAFVTNFAGSMGVIVTNQFGASKALSQLGTLANFIAYACMGIPAGIILKRKGYNSKITVTNEEKHVNFVEDFLKKDQPSAGQLHRYSFDMRA